jgi:hypothetical protein
MTDFRGHDNPASRYFKALSDTSFDQKLDDPLSHLTPTGGIDDALEGRTLLHVDELDSGSEKDQEMSKITSDLTGIDVIGGFRGKGLTVRHNIFEIPVPNYFIFCCSNDISDQTIRRM